METRRVFIVGDSLFAETLVRMLDRSDAVELVGAAPTPEAALSALAERAPDALILTHAGASPHRALDPLLSAHPDLPIVLADLNAGKVRVIVSRQVEARGSDLLAAIAELPKRNVMRDT